WALDEMSIHPTAVHRALERVRMRDALRGADAIVMNTPEAARRLRRSIPAAAQRIVSVVPNGFDAEDFGAPAPERLDGAFRVVHTGYLHTELGFDNRRRAAIGRVLGGGASDVDIRTRSHVYLVEAINRLAQRRPDLADRIEVH